MSNTDLEHDVTTAALYDIRDDIVERKKRLDAALGNIVDALLEKQTVKFKVDITSRWADHGEENVSAISKVSLAQAIENAGKKHHKINKRSDWQVDWTVSLLIGGYKFPLKKKYYKHLLPKIKR